MPAAGWQMAIAEDILPGWAAGSMKGASMEIDQGEMTVIGIIITWVAGIFGGGIAYEKLAGKVRKHESVLFTQEGEPRLISYPAHDIMVAHCHAKLDLKIAALTATNDDLKDDFKKFSEDMAAEIRTMSEALQKMALHQAAHAHHRKSDEI